MDIDAVVLSSDSPLVVHEWHVGDGGGVERTRYVGEGEGEGEEVVATTASVDLG